MCKGKLMSVIKKMLGKKIKQIRKSKNLTQERLAEMIGIEVPSLSNIETGKFAPSVDTLEKLSRTLDVNLWELYFFNTMSQQEMLEEIDKIIREDFETCRTVYYFLKALQ